MTRLLTTVLLLAGIAGPASSSPCADDIAALDGRTRSAATGAIASSTGGKAVAAAREGQGEDASRKGEPAVAEAPPEKSAEAGKGGDAAQQARVALDEARTADTKGDAGACAAAVARARKQLDETP